MNLDDESHLSAYLDDELDPADRRAVEWSVESSPPMADQLRALASARDAVAGLGRPAIPVDLAPAVAARLLADRRRARLKALARPGRVAVAVAGLSAMAASLLFALLLLHRSMHPELDPPTVVQTPAQDPESRTHPILPDSQPGPGPIRTNPTALAASGPTTPPDAPRPEAVAADEARERDDRLLITRMLEKPNVRLVLITTDLVDASERIRKVIERDARKSPEFGRITLRAGIVVDPAHPGAAEVFAVPIDEGSRESFLDRLREASFPVVEVGEAAPELITQLTEVGHVVVFQGTQAAPLVEPPLELREFVALRPDVPRDIFPEPRVVPGGGGPPAPRPDGAAPGAPRGPRPSVEPRPFVGPPLIPRSGESVTLLVWVTRPGKS